MTLCSANGSGVNNQQSPQGNRYIGTKILLLGKALSVSMGFSQNYQPTDQKPIIDSTRHARYKRCTSEDVLITLA